MEELIKTVAKLKIKGLFLWNILDNKAAMRQELFMDNVLNNEESEMLCRTSNFNFDGNIHHTETFGWETEVLGHL